MKYKIIKLFDGDVVDDERKLNFFQFCNQCNLTPTIVVDLVEEGILEPEGEYRWEWLFPLKSLYRARRVHRLQKTFELDLNSTALIMILLDRIENLEQEVTSQITFGNKHLKT